MNKELQQLAEAKYPYVNVKSWMPSTDNYVDAQREAFIAGYEAANAQKGLRWVCALDIERIQNKRYLAERRYTNPEGIIITVQGGGEFVNNTFYWHQSAIAAVFGSELKELFILVDSDSPSDYTLLLAERDRYKALADAAEKVIKLVPPGFNNYLPGIHEASKHYQQLKEQQ
jgi:hypothetical protein